MTEKNTIFDSRLREDEYIIWQSQSSSPQKKEERLKSSWLSKWIKIVFRVMISTLVFLTFVFSLIIWLIFVELYSIDIDDDLIVPLFFLFWLLLIGSISLVSSIVQKLRAKNQYVITNQRVLFYKKGSFQETSLILMQDAVKTKPRNGKSNINLYDKRSPTGQLPAPIATLNNLTEEDAETAYDLLVKARDLSFEERIEDMGLE